MPNAGTKILTFADACSALMALEERFRTAHVAAALDPEGRVLDMTAFTSQAQSIYDALDWASCLTANDPRVRRLVLLSLVREGVLEIRESDLALLRQAQSVFGRDGIEVVDWLQYDGELFRSLAITAGQEPWP